VGRTMGDLRNLWEDGIALGAVQGGRAAMALPESTRIEEGDSIIFSSESSQPQARINSHEEYLKEAELITSRVPKRASGWTAARGEDMEKKSILVCGWRSKWYKNTDHLIQRIMDMACSLGKDSNIVFINEVLPEDFENIVQTVFTKSGGGGQEGGLQALVGSLKDAKELVLPTWAVGPTRPGVTISHFHGDAACFSNLTTIFNSRAFNACVVLGTVAGLQLSPKAQDSRVLSITLAIRQLVADRQSWGCTETTHIVAENRLDQTALLAMTPQESVAMRESGKMSPLPDFINNQAIIARALCMAAAFPQMQRAIGELFDEADAGNSAQIDLSFAGIFLPLGTEISFGAVQYAVRGMERYTCIGYIDDQNTMVMCPSLSSKHTYNAGTRLILINNSDAGKEVSSASKSQSDPTVDTQALALPSDPARLSQPTEPLSTEAPQMAASAELRVPESNATEVTKISEPMPNPAESSAENRAESRASDVDTELAK